MSTTPPTRLPQTGSPAPVRSWQIAAWTLVLLAVGGQFAHAMIVGGLDFSVYRAGAATIFDTDGRGLDLYERHLIHLGGDTYLPFTYPPFAALLMLPFAVLPFFLGQALMVIFSMGVAWWVASLIYDYADHRGVSIPFQNQLGRHTTIAVLTVIILLSGPWRRGIALVQINPLIMLLVLADLIRPATRVPRGVLIGIAGGIKLTPLVFGLIPLVQRDWKGVLALGGSFAGTVALGFLMLPHQAVTFWTEAISDSSRVGNLNFVDNISTQGWLMHLTLTGRHDEMPNALLSILHYGLIAVLLVGVAAVLPVLHRRGMWMSSVALTAFLMLQMSPISWSHHNTWLPLIVAALCVDARPWLFSSPGASRSAAMVLGWVGIGGLYLSPLWLAIIVHQSTHGLDSVSRPGLILGALPVVALYALVLLWIARAWRFRREAPAGSR